MSHYYRINKYQQTDIGTFYVSTKRQDNTKTEQYIGNYKIKITKELVLKKK